MTKRELTHALKVGERVTIENKWHGVIVKRHNGMLVVELDNGNVVRVPNDVAKAQYACAHVAEYGEHAWTNDLNYAMHCVECGLIVADSRQFNAGV